MIDHRQRAPIKRLSSRLFVASALAAFAVGGNAIAQETVVIGGSGQSSVEVNLDALRDLDGRASQRMLRFPGEDTSKTVVLRPPGDARTAPAPRSRPAPAAPVAARPTVAAPVAPVARAPAPPPPARETAPAAPARVTPPAPPPAPPVARQTAPEPRVTPPPVAPAAPQQTAALPPTTLPAEGQALRLLFEGSSTQLDSDAEQQLKQMATALASNERRIQLKAFASGTSDRPSAARRESLSRALAVRSYLIENGVRSTRIDVRALGAPSDGGPSDRVDVILLTQ